MSPSSEGLASLTVSFWDPSELLPWLSPAPAAQDGGHRVCCLPCLARGTASDSIRICNVLVGQSRATWMAPRPAGGTQPGQMAPLRRTDVSKGWRVLRPPWPCTGGSE